VHYYELADIEALDAAYAFPPSDMRWMQRRKQAIIIGMECRPDSYCFCTSIGTADARAPADLFLTPIENGYVAEVHSPMGWMLLSDAGPPNGTTVAAKTSAGAKPRRLRPGWTHRCHSWPICSSTAV
jgi:hypothetical protein